MKKILAVLMCLAFMAVLLGVGICAQKTPPPPDYFPLKVGYWWKYKTVEKGYEFTLKVTGVEKVKLSDSYKGIDVDCYKVDTIVKMGDEEKTSFIDYYYKTNDAVYFIKTVYASNNMSVTYDPKRIYLINPAKIGDKWGWQGKGMMDVDIKEDSSVAKTDSVKVPAFPKGIGVITVDSKVNQGGTDVKKNYWYADGVGMVKSFTDTGAFKSTAELIQYNLKTTK